MAKKSRLKQAGSPQIADSEVSSHLQHRPVSVRRIARFIGNQYGPFIDVQDLREAKPEKRIECYLSRCLAAHAVAHYSGTTERQAAACVVDGGQDLGIDAIAFDESQKKCWLVQAKFQQGGQGLVDWSDVAKFLRGFDSVVSDNFDFANSKILALTEELRRATGEPGWRFVLVLAATSTQPISDYSIADIQNHLAYQDPGNNGIFTFENFTLNSITQSVQDAHSAARINLRIELEEWGCLTVPFEAYYGRVPVGSVVQWKNVGGGLFDKNLRNFDPSSQVVDSISSTLANTSDLFWYFNNGATILCEKIVRCGPYSTNQSREKGIFECTGVSVVNGAQTIGTIWNQPDNGADLDPRAMVHLRLISLEKAPPDFAQQVTKATNTQKNILPRDFATLDDEQKRIAKEFKMDGRIYVFRQNDPVPSPANGCTIEEAATALACTKSVDLATIAYRNPGYVIDPEHAAYKAIFGTAGIPTSEECWLAVKILRASEWALGQLRDSALVGMQRQVATHGKRYVQYRVFNDSTVKELRGAKELRDEDLTQVVGDATRAHFALVVDYIERKHKGEYLQVIFKNAKKVKEMEAALNPASGQSTKNRRGPQLSLIEPEISGN